VCVCVCVCVVYLHLQPSLCVFHCLSLMYVLLPFLWLVFQAVIESANCLAACVAASNAKTKTASTSSDNGANRVLTAGGRIDTISGGTSTKIRCNKFYSLLIVSILLSRTLDPSRVLEYTDGRAWSGS